MAQGVIDLLPTWLLRVYGDGGSKLIAEKFRLLEQAQLQRFGSTSSTQVSDDSCNPLAAETRYQLTGSHTNSKNRYRDIYPYEHSRVKLSSFEDRDYINASHLSVQGSSKKYIASQAPTPAAFNVSYQSNLNHSACLTCGRTFGAWFGNRKSTLL